MATTELTKIETFLSSQVNQGIVIAAVIAITGFVTQFASHNLALAAAVSGVSGVVAGLIWPANPAIKAAVIKLTSDVVTDVETKNVAGIPGVVADVGAVIEAAQPAVTVTTTTVTK